MRREDLTPDEVATMGTLLLVAGHETTANMTSLSILTLLREPEQMRRLRSDPTLIRGAVEELLRYLSIVHTGLPRVATEDVELGGRTIRAGDGVLLMINTANRDAEASPTPTRWTSAATPAATSPSASACTSAWASRWPAPSCRSRWRCCSKGLPNLRLAVPFEEIPFRHDMLIYGVHSLPVAW